MTGKLELVIEVTKSMFFSDAVGVRGCTGRVGWRKERVGVRRTRQKCQICLRPWRVKKVLGGFVCAARVPLKSLGFAGISASLAF